MRCTQTKARSETKDGREEFWRKHNRRVEENVEADMSDHSSPSSPSSSRAFDGFTHIYIYSQYILRIPFSSSIFHPLPQPQHASQLLQVGYARGRPAFGFANHALT